MTFSNKLIAQGRTASVYEWDEAHVVKLFQDWFPLEDIEYEQKLARAVHASGVKSPAAGEVVQVEDRNGLIYERVRGESMLDLGMRQPWKMFGYARLLARLHAQMHDYSFGPEIPSQRRKIQGKIQQAQALSDSMKGSLIQVMDQLPEGSCVCHGDFHPANVLIDGKESTVIDWIDASRGNPLADVARTSVILLGSAGTTRNVFMKLFIKTFHSTYLKEYFRYHPGGEKEYQRWLPVVAGARLSENIPELEEWLIARATPQP